MMYDMLQLVPKIKNLSPVLQVATRVLRYFCCRDPHTHGSERLTGGINDQQR